MHLGHTLPAAWLAARSLLWAALLAGTPALAAGDVLRMHGKAATGAKAVRAEAFRGGDRTPAGVLQLKELPASATKAMPAPGEKALRIGIPRDVEREAEVMLPREPLAWTAAAGGWAARISVTSPGAAALRVGLVVKGAPDVLEMRVQGNAPRASTLAAADGRALREAMAAYGVYWTPVTAGETQLVELFVPSAVAPSRVRLQATTVSHLEALPATGLKAGGGALGTCHENVACVASINPAVATASRAVAKLVYTKNGATFLCTGTLINDGGESEVPYLYTAAHCLDSQAAAATLNSLWFFESADCGGQVMADDRQLTGGASLLWSDAATDVALVRLADRAPAGAWFSGWDATPLAGGTPMIGVHHPMGDLKKLAIGTLVPDADARFLDAAWLSGTTEPGSSGSGLFTLSGGEYLLRGGLRGGTASCASTGDLANKANRDVYSRLDEALPTLRKWLGAGPMPVEDFSGLWYDADEPGWGLSITQSPDGATFVTWYTYGADGNSTWYFAPTVTWTSGVALEAALYRARGSWNGAPYDPSLVSSARAGTLRLQFGHGSANLAIDVEGRSIAKPLVKLAP